MSIHRIPATVLVLAASAQALAQLPAPLSIPLLSNTHGNVEAGWYASSRVYKYIADLNIGFDFGSWKDAHFNFRGGILTLVKSTPERSFQPDRYRGTLEPGIYRLRGRNLYSFSIRHQSFHTIDRPPDLREAYELYNLGYQRQGSPNLTFALGRYLNRQQVDYTWDFLAEIDTACIGTCRSGRIYVSATGHWVKEDKKLANRNSFFDYALELGIESKWGVRYFMALRRIHDIDRFNGTTDRQFVFGIKYLW